MWRCCNGTVIPTALFFACFIEESSSSKSNVLPIKSLWPPPFQFLPKKKYRTQFNENINCAKRETNCLLHYIIIKQIIHCVVALHGKQMIDCAVSETNDLLHYRYKKRKLSTVLPVGQWNVNRTNGQTQNVLPVGQLSVNRTNGQTQNKVFAAVLLFACCFM